jgi:acyl-CoA thioesterase-1
MKNRKQNSLARIMVIAAIFSILFMAYVTTGGQVFAEDASNVETIVCLGDSLTAGANATVLGKDDKSKSWPAFLQNKVNIPVINAGVSGDTTAKGLARVKKDVLSKNPGIVIIVLGINDKLQKIPLATTKKNLQKIIDMVNDGKRKIYLAKWYIDWNEQSINMFNTLASSNNIELIENIWEWDDVWEVKENMSADGNHPNAKGYEILADKFFNALKLYLEANNLLKE